METQIKVKNSSHPASLQKDSQLLPYEEWLTTIANTRLLFNTLKQLEDFLGTHSIHNNGIKRAFPTEQKMRAAYRDLKEEVLKLTDYNYNLTDILTDYKEASLFYKERLSRRLCPRKIALDILNYKFRPNVCLSKSKADFNLLQEICSNYNIVIMVLLLIKALPGYDSKNGDVMDIHEIFEDLVCFFEGFLKGDEVFDVVPSLIMAKEEVNKTRLKLIFHTMNIIGTYIAFSNASDTYEMSIDIKQSVVSMNMDGCWNECGGTAHLTAFWEFQEAANKGVYFARHWKKNGDILSLDIYTVCFLQSSNGKLILYMLHPEAMKHRVEGKQYTDADHIWYEASMPETFSPNNLYFRRVMSSHAWNLKFNLTKVVDEEIISIYRSWLKYCKVMIPFEAAKYDMQLSLYAVTKNDLYVVDLGRMEDKQQFQLLLDKSVSEELTVDNLSDKNDSDNVILYQIPRDAFDGLDAVGIDDNVGIMNMGDKRYLAFDDLLMYIEITEENLKKYGIEITDKII